MSDAETHLPALEAAPALAASAPDDLRPLIDEQLRMLGELADLGLQAARAVVEQAHSDSPPPAAEIALAYSRVSRAVRLTIMLQTKLMESRGEQEQRQDIFTPEYRRKVRVENIVARIADTEAEDQDAADAIVVEAGERLDDEDLYGDLMDRPLSEIVARLCKDLGLEPDWSELSQELWAKREAESATTPYLPREAAGGGPAAERSEERLVEGASQAHDAYDIGLTDSS